METGESWGPGVGWAQVAALIEIAKQPVPMEWSAERREIVIQRMLLRMEQNRARRRMWRAVTVGLAAVLLVGVSLGLAGVGGDWLRPPFRIASKAVSQRLFAAD